MKIPETWKLIKFGDLKGENGLISDGDWIVSQNMNPNGEVRLIQLADIGLGEFLNRSNKFINLDKFQELNCTEIKENDILISRMADPIGRACIFPKLPQKAITAVDVTILRTDKTIAEPYYVMYLCNSSYFLEQAKSLATGTTRSRITRRNLEKIQIPLPLISEQRRIVEILDQADALRKQRIHANKVCDRILPALFLKMFGDPATNPMGWDVVYVKDLFAKKRSGVKCGPFGSALKRDEYVNTGIPVWGIDNVKKNEFIESGSLFITEDKYKELTNYSVESGDILISRAGTVGRMCVAKPQQHPSIIGTNLIRLSLDKNKIIPDYFSCLCSYFSENINQLRASSDINSYSFMNTNSIKSLQIPLPPIDLQKKYYNFLSTVVTIKNQSSNSENKLEKLFNILLHRAFSGELTAKWREGHLKELLAEMEHQSKVLNLQTELF